MSGGGEFFRVSFIKPQIGGQDVGERFMFDDWSAWRLLLIRSVKAKQPVGFLLQPIIALVSLSEASAGVQDIPGGCSRAPIAAALR